MAATVTLPVFTTLENRTDKAIKVEDKPSSFSNTRYRWNKASNYTPTALPCIVYPHHNYCTVDNAFTTKDNALPMVFNIARGTEFTYTSGIDSWNEIVWSNYVVQVPRGSCTLGYIKPGTRPSFLVPPLFSTIGKENINTGIRVSIQRTEAYLYIDWDVGEWSGTGQIGTLQNPLKFSASDFVDGVVPSKLLIEINSGGGSGGSNSVGNWGGGGQSGGYWCGVVDLLDRALNIYGQPAASGIGGGSGQNGNQGGSIYMWRGTESSFNQSRLEISGGAGGTASGGASSDSGGKKVRDSLTDCYQRAYKEGKTGGAGNTAGSDFPSFLVKSSEYYCENPTSGTHWTTMSRGGRNGGPANSGGGGGASAFDNGASGHNSAIKGAGGGGGDLVVASGAGGECVILIHY